MIRTSTLLASVIILLDSAFGSPSADRTTHKAIQQPPLQYERSVALKLIQVYVTDKTGNPVQDLTVDDFVVLDNGKPMTLTAFEKHGLPMPGTGEPPEVTPNLTPATSPSLSRKFVLFFDFAFNNHRGVAASVAAALHFLDSGVRPADLLDLEAFCRGFTPHSFRTARPGPDPSDSINGLLTLS